MKIEINNSYNIDCMVGLRQMQEQGLTANLLLTDIPYGVTSRQSNGLRGLDKAGADISTFDLGEFLKLVDNVITENFVIFCGTEQVSQIRRYFADKGYTTRLIIWEKKNSSPMNGQHNYLSGVECAVYAKKRGGTFNAHCKNTVMRHNAGRNKIHPTQKSLPLWCEILGDLSNEGQTVLDTCAGSGTTAVACLAMNRNYICFEIDPEYFEQAKRRLETNP